jgi:alkylated DNA repair dioxygenase AlkB
MPNPPPPKNRKTPGKLVLRPNNKDNSPGIQEEEDSLYSDVSTPVTPNLSSTTRKIKSGKNGENSEDILDVTSTESTPDRIRNRLETSLKVKCPCGKSDSKSTYIICAKCKQQWHNKCCNLTGLLPAAIKKLEHWECPRCYSCPALGQQPATLHAEISIMRAEINKLHERSSSYECCQKIGEEIAVLKSQIAELVEVTKQNEVQHKLAPNLEAAIKNVSSLSPETMTNIETNLTELTQQVSSVKESVKSLNKSEARNSSSRPSNHPSLGPSMQPNTESPHVRKKISAPCPAYMKYESNAVSQELKEEIHNLVTENAEHLTTVGEDSRQVLYFGEHSYKYTGKEHPAKPMPPVLTKLLSTIQEKLPSDLGDKGRMNSCLISRYETGSNHIPMHRDDEPVIDPESLILTVSIGAERKMTFADNDENTTEELVLEDRSLLITSRYAQDFWSHGVLADESVAEERISLTFRNIAPFYINSTKILGDSNTAHIKFGEGVGTLGVWVPGQRVKVGHIEELPDATKIGPYRNIVIHTGVNSINNPRYRKSNSYLLHFLENRCKDIIDVYPKAKIHISLLLPSRSRELNNYINEFNRGILDMTYRVKNLLIIDNSIFGDILSDEHGRWDVNQQRPFANDILDLGRNGIKTLAMNFKMSLMNKSKSQSRSRFNAGSGSYRGAMDRSHYVPGYQPAR